MFKDLIFNEKTNNLKFEVSNIDISILNALRRILLSDIPILGFKIDDNLIEIEENTSVLNNEIISNRLCQIPININDEYNENFDNEINSFEITLDVKSDLKTDMMNITTDNFIVFINKIQDKNTKKYFNYDSISNEPILLTRLKNNEILKFKAKAVKDTGRYNASYNMVSGLSVYNKPNDKSTKNSIIDKERDIIKNVYIFHFESINKTISHDYLFNQALNILIYKLNVQYKIFSTMI